MCKETATLIEERHFLLRERNTMDKEGIRSEKSEPVQPCHDIIAMRMVGPDGIILILRDMEMHASLRLLHGFAHQGKSLIREREWRMPADHGIGEDLLAACKP